jgi:beta-hydroxylase
MNLDWHAQWLRQRFLSTGFQLLRALEKVISQCSLVSLEPFLDPAQFDWVAELEGQWPRIRAELDALLTRHAELPNFQDISVDQSRLTDDDRWKTYFFYAYGVRAEANCARCPATARALERVPGMTTAMFSILSPRKSIPLHRGPFKGVLRYHLGLLVPPEPDACGIEVGGVVAHWAEGKSLVFDDTYQHRVWNDTDHMRVVLFLDVIRPLRPPGSWVNQAVIKAVALSPYVRDGRKRHKEWERRFGT